MHSIASAVVVVVVVAVVVVVIVVLVVVVVASDLASMYSGITSERMRVSNLDGCQTKNRDRFRVCLKRPSPPQPHRSQKVIPGA